MLPVGSRSKGDEIDQGSATHDLPRNLDHAGQTDQSPGIDLVLFQQFVAVAKIPQKPGQLPKDLRRAGNLRRKGAAKEWLWFKDVKAELIEGLVLVPAILRMLHSHEIKARWDIAL